MEVSKIHGIFDLHWIQLKVDGAKIFALVPRTDTDNANSHGYILEDKNFWRCAALDSSGDIIELGIQPNRIQARQKVQKQIIAVRQELDDIREKNVMLNGDIEDDSEAVAGIEGFPC